MPDVTPNGDPLAALARFTPASGPDAAELLFAAGRASARTPVAWKLAAAALAVANAALVAALALRPAPVAPPPAPLVPPAVPVLAGPPEPPAAVPPAGADDPSSYRWLRTADPDALPRAAALGPAPERPPLSILSGRNGEID